MTIREWLCAHNFHKIRIIRVLKGGEGPDNAGWEVECSRCGWHGWKYCDGSIELRFSPLIIEEVRQSPYRDPAILAIEVPVRVVPARKFLPKPRNFYLYVGFSIGHWMNTFLMAFVRPAAAIGASVLAVLYTSVTLFVYFYWKKHGEIK